MNEQNQRDSIMSMARGAFEERVDYEMDKVIQNILDPNTKATAKRKITLTIELTPDDERRTIGVSVSRPRRPSAPPLSCWRTSWPTSPPRRTQSTAKAGAQRRRPYSRSTTSSSTP